VHGGKVADGVGARATHASGFALSRVRAASDRT
jgi:hypothetical protein